jgi:hypothetical protein
MSFATNPQHFTWLFASSAHVCVDPTFTSIAYCAVPIPTD